MRGSDKPHPYAVRSFAYRTEQVRVNEVQKVIVYNTTYISKVIPEQIHGFK